MLSNHSLGKAAALADADVCGSGWRDFTADAAAQL